MSLCIALRCSRLKSVAVCLGVCYSVGCSGLQWVVVGCSALGKARIECGKHTASCPKQALMMNELVCCSVLQCVAACCSVLQSVAEFGEHPPSHCNQACIMYESCLVCLSQITYK